MTSEEVTADVRRFLRVKGNCMQKIETGVSGLPAYKGKLTQAQVRDRSKRHFRKGQIDSCDGDKSK